MEQWISVIVLPSSSAGKQRRIHEICFAKGSGRRMKQQCFHSTKLHCFLHLSCYSIPKDVFPSTSGLVSQAVVKVQDKLSRYTVPYQWLRFLSLATHVHLGAKHPIAIASCLSTTTLPTCRRSCLGSRYRDGAGPKSLDPGMRVLPSMVGRTAAPYPFCDLLLVISVSVLYLPPIAFEELVMSRCHPSDPTRRALSRST